MANAVMSECALGYDDKLFHALRQVAGFNMAMSVGLAKMRNVDNGDRIVRQNMHPFARRHRLQHLAQFQNGQGADQSDGIYVMYHGDVIRA